MKKILGLILAVTIVTPMFIACGGNSVKINTQADSINYAFGAANADGIRKYVLMADTADAEKVEQFCMGINEAMKEQTTKERLSMEGFRLGISMQQEISTGFLLNDSTIPAKHDLIVSTFKQALKGKDCFMTVEEGNMYFQQLLAPALQTGASANLTPEQADTVNMLIGLLNADGARRYILAKDTTNSDINIFVKGFNKGLNDKKDNTAYVSGIEIAQNIYP